MVPFLLRHRFQVRLGMTALVRNETVGEGERTILRLRSSAVAVRSIGTSLTFPLTLARTRLDSLYVSLCNFFSFLFLFIVFRGSPTSSMQQMELTLKLSQVEEY